MTQPPDALAHAIVSSGIECATDSLAWFAWSLPRAAMVGCIRQIICWALGRDRGALKSGSSDVLAVVALVAQQVRLSALHAWNPHG